MNTIVCKSNPDLFLVYETFGQTMWYKDNPLEDYWTSVDQIEPVDE